MARPAIARLFDTKIRIWRPTSSTDSLAIEQRSYAPVGEVGAVTNRSTTITAEVQGGMERNGSLRWYGRPNINIRPRDVCDIIEGPDAGSQWEVDALPTHLRGHHTQVDCVEWHGHLPSLEPDS